MCWGQRTPGPMGGFRVHSRSSRAKGLGKGCLMGFRFRVWGLRFWDQGSSLNEGLEFGSPT